MGCWVKRLVYCFFVAAQVWAVDPVPEQNYCPIVIENKTGLAASEIYFIAHGQDDRGVPCYLVPDMVTGKCAYVYPGADGSNGSVASSRTLSQIPVATNTAATSTAYLIYLPINSSSRAYLSLNSPMFIATTSDASTGYILISDPAVDSLNDPNYYTLYQDFEFGLDESQVDSSTNIFLNLSWVDYFCLPMQLNSYSYPTNSPIVIPAQQKVIPAGTESSLNRGTIIGNVNSDLLSYETTASNPNTWSALGLIYYANPYIDTTSSVYLRILAAKNSITYGANGVKFIGAANPQKYFPSTYASSTTLGPSASTSFMEAVYNYYNTGGHSLSAQIKPSGEPHTVYTITSVSGGSANLTLQFVDTSVMNKNLALNLNDLSMDQLLSGSVWPFYPLTMTDTVDVAVSNELSKLVSALFTVGQLPFTAYTTSVGSPFPNTNEGFATLTYFSNPTGFNGGPWWNGYDKAMHLQMINQGLVPKNPTLGFGYAYDFDDLLNMSGLVAGLTIQNTYANPSTESGASEPYIMISMESLDGMTIPNISNDTYTYQVTMGPAANGTAVKFTYFNGTMDVTTNASVSANTVLTPSVTVNPSHPFIITFTYDGVEHSFSINLLHQAVIPVAPPGSPPGTDPQFTGVDRKYQAGVTFAITNEPTTDPQFMITYDSSPPPWSR